MASIHRIVVGKWHENSYVVYDDKQQAVVIDPGDDASVIEGFIEERSLSLKAIINTHAHFDHVGAVAELKESYGVPFYLHSGDWKLLAQANLYRALFLGQEKIKVPSVDHDLAKFDTLSIGDLVFRIIPCPGHTPGGVCFQIEDALFSGDTLLSEKPGRTDLPGGDRQALVESVRNLFCLPKSMTVYPGHGEPRTLGETMSSNSEIAELLR